MVVKSDSNMLHLANLCMSCLLWGVEGMTLLLSSVSVTLIFWKDIFLVEKHKTERDNPTRIFLQGEVTLKISD